jgi:hypothetical protein
LTATADLFADVLIGYHRHMRLAHQILEERQQVLPASVANTTPFPHIASDTSIGIHT